MTYGDAIDATFHALGDPTRRALLDRLRTGPLPVCDLAADLPISRPAVSQHLRVLSEAGLLLVTPQGTRRLYSIAPDGIAALRTYLDTVWDDALAGFAAAAHAQAAKAARKE
ncbi:ArsR/SmtB family transcription factor [Flavimaricola marinus]|uniref:HTH-type transcriptional regulator n=1 Tax=Flavimaricola marinus TaxID=1819565 RepID=A0A238LIK5_9RHOB|nr:metalloregulator ArsR/SmtB family transcription factor [Flavimaricola marinus]SMY09557.1 HTH-type transcriptional regulator [Flavimaricola marinus]